MWHVTFIKDITGELDRHLTNNLPCTMLTEMQKVVVAKRLINEHLDHIIAGFAESRQRERELEDA